MKLIDGYLKNEKQIILTFDDGSKRLLDFDALMSKYNGKKN